ncbi:uncharacterized protein BDV17DRAFT_275127 [Aspergillus undulatus]|uniref:uncharacterized protein n=1 Tax=Aspergillus undulatus TaxID=1810928 RepID=UPI003CCCCCC1
MSFRSGNSVIVLSVTSQVANGVLVGLVRLNSVMAANVVRSRRLLRVLLSNGLGNRKSCRNWTWRNGYKGRSKMKEEAALPTIIREHSLPRNMSWGSISWGSHVGGLVCSGKLERRYMKDQDV